MQHAHTLVPAARPPVTQALRHDRAFWQRILAVGHDGNVDGTKLELALDKRWRKYIESKRNLERIEALASKRGIAMADFVVGGHCTKPLMLHPDAALAFALWCSTDVVSQMSAVVFDLLNGRLQSAEAPDVVQPEVMTIYVDIAG